MVRIGIIGDFNPRYQTHTAINSAIEHVAIAVGERLYPEWVPTRDLATGSADKVLARFSGLWAAPASPYESADGMLNGIKFARTHDVPFTGT